MPPKKEATVSVGARIACPGRVFGRPGDPAYPGTVTAVRGNKVDIRFDEDGSKYWFPAADAATWVVSGGGRGSAAASPTRATAMTRAPSRSRPAGRGLAAAAVPASPSPPPGGRAGGPRPMVRSATRGSGAAAAAAAPARSKGGASPAGRGGDGGGRPRLRSAGAVFHWLPFVSDSAALAALGGGLAVAATAASYWVLRVAAPGPDKSSIPLA